MTDRLRTPPPPSQAGAWAAQHSMLAKAASAAQSRSTSAVAAMRAMSARVEASGDEPYPNGLLPPAGDPHGTDYDPTWAVQSLDSITGHREKADPYGGPRWSTWQLRSLARMFVVAIVIERITAEVERFAIRQDRPGAPGAVVRLREGKRPPTKIEQAVIDTIWDELRFSGVLGSHDERYHRDTFRTYMRKACRDRLELDRVLTEYVPDKMGRPARFLALDGAMGRLAYDKESGLLYPVQVGRMGLTPLAEWKPGDPHKAHLAMQRQASIAEWAGYGHGELEDVWQLVFGLSKGIEHNFTAFDHGLTSAGIIAMSGNVNTALLQSTRRFIESTMVGSRNNRRVAVMAHPGEKPPTWIPFSNATMKDMEWIQFLHTMIKWLCAAYRVDAAGVLGMDFGKEGQSSSMGNSNSQWRIDYTRNEGVVSIAEFLLGGVNDYYVQAKYPDFEIGIGGVDDDSIDAMNKRDKDELNWKGPNPILASRDEKQLKLSEETELANVPLPYVPGWIELQRMKAQPGGPAPETPANGRSAPADSKDAFDLNALLDRTGIDPEKTAAEANSEAEAPVRKSLMTMLERGLRDGSILAVGA